MDPETREKERIEKIKNATRSYRLNLRAINHPMFGKLSKLTTAISLTACAVIVVILSIAIDKMTDFEYNSLKMMEEKVKIRKIMVHDTVRVNDCDTVYIINGQRFNKID